MNPAQLKNILLSLATEDGINASGKDEIYGCIFGRDSAKTILKILRVYSKSPQEELLKVSKRALLTLCSLQGKEINIESGEEIFGLPSGGLGIPGYHPRALS